MSTLLSLPVSYYSKISPTSWPGVGSSSAIFTKSSRSHLTGDTNTDNGQKLGETINPSRGGSIYTDSDGFYSWVQTKTSTIFYSKCFIGDLNGNTIKSGNSISSSTNSTWTQDVIGFHCEVSRAPHGSGSEGDGCGRVDQFRVAGVYADGNSKVRIMEMTKGGVKKGDYTYDADPGTGWKYFAYALDQSDSLNVVNNKWLLYGWIVEMRHKKTCGGNSKQKNCTGRMRYLRPIISPTGSDGLRDSYTKNQLIFHHDTTLSTAKSNNAKQLQHY